MGCETSRQQNNDIVSIETEEQFKLSYRQLVSQDRGHIFQLYHFSTIINRSNYSIVRKVTSRASSQSRVCKIIPLVNKKYFTVVSEVQFLKKLDHPNVIQVVEYFLEPSFLYIVMEQVPGSRILPELNKIKNGILFSDLVQIIKQLLGVVEFCHRKSIAHRTITTQNLLLFWGQKIPFLKLIDFSQACAVGCSKTTSILNEKRNLILHEQELKQADRMDIYDCGIVILSLLSGKRIKGNNITVNYNDILQQSVTIIKNAQLTIKIQSDLIDLLSQMLAENPKSRPSASTCLKHGFFQNFKNSISSRKALECLMQFEPQNNLKYLLSMYASLNMTSSIQKAQYLSEFYNLDKNRDGQIQFEQLVEGIKNTFNFQQEKAVIYAQQMFTNLDKNKSGCINFSQYITGTIKLSKLISNDFLQKMFNQIDTNKDGYISEQEVNNLIVGIDKYDVMSGLKQVNFSQFKQIMLKIMEKGGHTSKIAFQKN